MDRTVGEVAALAHVSVRTLHHYDRIGLLRPAGRSAAGYRVYGPADLEALQEILLYRAVGMGLAEIRRVRDDPAYGRHEALLAHRERLASHLEGLRQALELVDRTLAAYEGGPVMGAQDMFAGLGDFDPAEHEAEVVARWGDTDAYRESARRTRGYAREDWARYQAASDEVHAALAALMGAGVPPTDPRAAALAERHRMLIDEWFYPCPPAMHRSLGEMYVADPRFTATYDRIRPGLAGFLRAAIDANAGEPSPSGG